MPERVGHEFGDHKLGGTGFLGYPPALQREPGELAREPGRFDSGGKRVRGGRLAGLLALGHIIRGQNIRHPQRQPLSMRSGMAARREEAVVAHAGVLRPGYRDDLRADRIVLDRRKSHLARPGCKRYHPPCNLQTQGLMHVQMGMTLAYAGSSLRRRLPDPEGLGGPM
jgi:hypothetical protein